MLRSLQNQPKPPAAPTLGKLPTAPSEPPSSPIKGLQNWGTVLAIFGSLLTRAPLTSALNAAAAGMTAYNQKRYKDYQLNLQKFRSDLQSAIAQNAQELQQYNAALSATKINVDEGLAKARAVALANHDEIGLATLHQQGALGLARLGVMRENAAINLERINAEVANNARANGAKLVTAFLARGLTPPKSVIEDAGLDPSDPVWKAAGGGGTEDTRAKNLATYTLLTGKSPSMGMGNTPMRQRYNDALADAIGKSPQAPARIVQTQSALKASSTALDKLISVDGQVGTFGATLEANMKALMPYVRSGALATGGGTALNHPIQYLRHALAGDPNVSALAAMVMTVQDEYARFLTTTAGGGATTVEAQNRASATFNLNMSPRQFMATLNAMHIDSVNRATAYQHSITAVQDYQGHLAGAFAQGQPLPPAPDISGLIGSATPSLQGGGAATSGAPQVGSVVGSPTVHIGQKATLADGRVVQWNGTAWVPAR